MAKKGDEKLCARCLERKPLEEFGKCSRSRDGLKSYCSECNAQLCREWRRRKDRAAGRGADLP